MYDLMPLNMKERVEMIEGSNKPETMGERRGQVIRISRTTSPYKEVLPPRSEQWIRS